MSSQAITCGVDLDSPVTKVAKTRDDVLMSIQSLINPRCDLRWGISRRSSAYLPVSLTSLNLGNSLHTLLMPSGEAI